MKHTATAPLLFHLPRNMFPLIHRVQAKCGQAANEVGCRGRDDNAVDGGEQAEEEHQGDVQKALPQNGEKECVLPAADSLEERNECIGTGGERRADAKNPKETHAER